MYSISGVHMRQALTHLVILWHIQLHVVILLLAGQHSLVSLPHLHVRSYPISVTNFNIIKFMTILSIELKIKAYNTFNLLAWWVPGSLSKQCKMASCSKLLKNIYILLITPAFHFILMKAFRTSMNFTSVYHLFLVDGRYAPPSFCMIKPTTLISE